MRLRMGLHRKRLVDRTHSDPALRVVAAWLRFVKHQHESGVYQ
jgi:hypothetical protein